MHKSGCRGIAKKVRAAVLVRANRSDRTAGETSHRAVARREHPALVDGARDRARRRGWIRLLAGFWWSHCDIRLGGLRGSCSEPVQPAGWIYHRAAYQVTCSVTVERLHEPDWRDALDCDHQRMLGRCRGCLPLMPAEPWANRHHHQLDATCHIGEPVQWRRECRVAAMCTATSPSPTTSRPERPNRASRRISASDRPVAGQH